MKQLFVIIALVMILSSCNSASNGGAFTSDSTTVVSSDSTTVVDSTKSIDNVSVSSDTTLMVK